MTVTSHWSPLASLDVRGQSPYGREKHSLTLKNSKDKSPYFAVDVNSNIGSCFGPLTRMSKEHHFSNHFV